MKLFSCFIPPSLFLYVKMCRVWLAVKVLLRLLNMQYVSFRHKLYLILYTITKL